MNALTGLGSHRDKLHGFRFRPSYTQHDPETLEALYHEDDIAARIVDAPAEHMLRGWIDLKIQDEEAATPGVVAALPGVKPAAPSLELDGLEASTATLEKLKDLKAEAAFLEALVWEGVFGGSAILIGADDGRPLEEPLDLDNVADVRFLNVLDRRDLIPWRWFSDPRAADYGEPELYQLAPSWRPGFRAKGEVQPPPPVFYVHASRLIVFPGLRASRRAKMRNNGWGMPSLSRAYNALRQFNANWSAVGNILQDASQGVFKIKGLIDMIAAGAQEELLTRLELIDTGRSVARSLVIDAEDESFERKDTTMSGLPQILDQTSTRVAAAAKMPVTILMGRSPAGMNATGESDSRNWYDTLEVERTTKLLPRMTQLLRVIFRSKLGPTKGREPKSWNVVFAPLWTPTPKEDAELKKLHADTDSVRIQSGVLTPEEVAISRFRPEGYSDEIQIDLEAREEALRAYEEKLASGEGELPAIPAPGELPGAGTPEPEPPAVKVPPVDEDGA
jgi:phage-related protein (TIGR01555 family)